MVHARLCELLPITSDRQKVAQKWHANTSRWASFSIKGILAGSRCRGYEHLECIFWKAVHIAIDECLLSSPFNHVNCATKHLPCTLRSDVCMSVHWCMSCCERMSKQRCWTHFRWSTERSASATRSCGSSIEVAVAR